MRRLKESADSHPVGVSALGIGLVGLVDHLTGWEVGISILYIAPLVVVAWHGTLGQGLVMSLLAGGCWLGVDLFSGHPYSHPWIPVWNSLVRLAFFILIVWLIQTQRRIQDQLTTAKQEAERANRAKDTFLAAMSHELRTPLNAIINYAELLAEEAQDRGLEGQLQDLGRIRRAGRHLLHLINNVLDFTKIDAGKLELFLEDFRIEEMLEETLAVVEPLITSHGNRLVVECPGDLPLIHSDPLRIRQILFNLLGNAAKFTSGGTIWLEISLVEHGGVPHLQIAVRDTGLGMSEEELARVFEPFVQVGPHRARGQTGSGLGLTISRMLCRSLGGDITASSTPRQGSRFVVTLPLVWRGEKISESLSDEAGRTSPEPTPGEARDGQTVAGGR